MQPTVTCGLSLCGLLNHERELYQNGWIKQDAIWVQTLWGPTSHVLAKGPDPPWEAAILWDNILVICNGAAVMQPLATSTVVTCLLLTNQATG